MVNEQVWHEISFNPLISRHSTEFCENTNFLLTPIELKIPDIPFLQVTNPHDRDYLGFQFDSLSPNTITSSL